MDFDNEFRKIGEKVNQNVKSLKDLETLYKKSKDFTCKFLNECEKVGIEKVSVCRKHESIESTQKWPFGVSGSVFAMGNHNGWPAIWGVVEKLGISGGAGNGGQHQADTSSLIDGVYHLKNGKWIKIED